MLELIYANAGKLADVCPIDRLWTALQCTGTVTALDTLVHIERVRNTWRSIFSNQRDMLRFLHFRGQRVFDPEGEHQGLGRQGCGSGTGV